MTFANPFGFPIFHEVIENGEELAENLCKDAYDLRDKDPNGKLISHAWHKFDLAKSKDDYKEHGYTSHGAYQLSTDERFDGIHNAAVAQAQKYTKNLEADPRFYITNSWVSIYGNGHFAPEHIHSFAHLACVFYGATSEGTGEIVFRNPAAASYNMVYGNGFNLWNDRYTLKPTPGMMVIFPAHMAHFTNPHMSDVDRVIFSCNIVFEECTF